jgi:hypothetical protein
MPLEAPHLKNSDSKEIHRDEWERANAINDDKYIIHEDTTTNLEVKNEEELLKLIETTEKLIRKGIVSREIGAENLSKLRRALSLLSKPSIIK